MDEKIDVRCLFCVWNGMQIVMKCVTVVYVYDDTSSLHSSPLFPVAPTMLHCHLNGLALVCWSVFPDPNQLVWRDAHSVPSIHGGSWL